MKAASLNELQKELATLPLERVLELCGRLARYKKENKELLTYLLFEANDEAAFVQSVMKEMDMQFGEMNKSNVYLAKKSFRKILRMINKFIRYSGDKKTELELRIHYCKKIKKSGVPIDESKVLVNLYNNQIKKTETVLSKLHEDLQYDYKRELKDLV